MSKRNNVRVGRGFDDDDWMPDNGQELERERELADRRNKRREKQTNAIKYLDEKDE